MRLIHSSVLLLLACLLGCAGRPLTAHRVNVRDLPVAGEVDEAIAISARQMGQSVDGMRLLMKSANRKGDFLQPREHDMLEQLLGDYLSCRRELGRISECESCDKKLRQEALRHRADRDLELASLSLEAPWLWRAMNQSYHRSRIPAGSCDRILHEVTVTRGLKLAKEDRTRLQNVISRHSVLLPAVENELRHAPPTEVLWDMGRSAAAGVRRCQAVLIASTGRIKNPFAHPLSMTAEQRQQIRDSLQPGDVLLTYTEGYVSNLLIPGTFKHAATFVGTVEERCQADLPPDLLLGFAKPGSSDLATVLHQTTTKTGEPADVVESVAEGVEFCNLDRILQTRVNRLVVLRPQLNVRERAEQIADVLSYVGDEYDFSFDLTDASDQICTEVVYRSLQARGGIDLPLSEHAWRLTLTADDILRCALRNEGTQFSCILMADESPTSPGDARIMNADQAQEWLSRQPALGGETSPAMKAPQRSSGKAPVLRGRAVFQAEHQLAA